MELFNLLAKLTLDKSEFDKALDSAQSEADSFSPPDDQTLELDNSEYTESLDDAETASSDFSGSVQSIFSNLKGVLAGLGIAAVVTGIVTQLKEGVDLARTHGDTIDKQSQKMMISKKAYQEYAYALELSGASIDDLNKGMRKLQQIPGEGLTEDQQKAFEALGISAESAVEQIEQGMENGDLTGFLDKIISGIADTNSSDQGWITAALFGNNATGLNAFFNQTSRQIEEAKKEAEDLGMVMSDEEVANAAAYNDATTRLQGALNGIKEAFAADVIPLLTDAANTVAKIVAFFNPRTKKQSLSDMFADDDEQFAETLVDIEGTAAAAETLADKLLAMGDTSKMTAEQYAIWKGTAQELIDLVPTLGDAIDLESGQINANSEEIKENIKQWEALAKQKALQTLKEEKYQAIVEKNKDLVDQTVEANKKAAETEKARISSLDKINALLTENGFDELGENATLQDVFDAQTALVTANPDNANLQIQFGRAIQEWTSANREAIEAQEQVKKLEEEISKGEQEYQAWLEAADRLYGTADEQATDASESVEELTEDVKKLKQELSSIPFGKLDIKPHGYAIGTPYVPYDQVAMLHRGERVLTATENRQASSGADLTGLEDKIIAAIRAGMNGATVHSYLNGKDITDEVNRNNMQAVKGRRYQG